MSLRTLLKAATLLQPEATDRSGSTTYSQVVKHGATAGTARPAGAVQVAWIGTVAPTNALTDDLFMDESSTPATLKRYTGSTFEAMVGAAGAALDSTTYSPLSVVATPAVMPSPTNRQPLDFLAPGDRVMSELVGGSRVTRRLGRANSGADLEVDAPLHMGTRRNLWQYTEDLGSSRYATVNSTKQTDTVVVDGITLTRWSASNFFGTLRSQVSGLGLTPFVAGSRYLLSFYAASRYAGEQFLWNRGNIASGGDYGHGARLLTHRPRRIWRVVQAVDTSHIDEAAGDPSAAWGSGGASDAFWLQLASADGGAADVYVGGFQIELVASTTVDGMAVIGDSRMAGSAGAKDVPSSREVSRYVEGILNISCYNRAVGGRKLTDIDTAYATDVTPIKHRCKYVLAQGGINDFAVDSTLATVQAAASSINTKAAADGLIPVFVTVEPSVSVGGTTSRENNRQAFNSWLRTTFPYVIDIASVIEDPVDPRYIRRDAGWWGDGTHYGLLAKRAVAAYIASWPGWDFTTPAPYQPLTAATYTNPSALYRDGVQVVGARDTGWTAGTGTPLKGAFAADTATATQAAQRVLALEAALRAHGLIN